MLYSLLSKDSHKSLRTGEIIVSELFKACYLLIQPNKKGGQPILNKHQTHQIIVWYFFNGDIRFIVLNTRCQNMS